MADEWEGIVKDWENIPIETYTFIFSQVKDRYEEYMSESESITNKTFTLAAITVAGLSAFAGFKFGKAPNPIFFNVVMLVYGVNILCIFNLIFPKSIIQRGSPPKSIFKDYLDDPLYEGDEKTKLAYYMELRKYQDRMDVMDERLTTRKYVYVFLLLTTMASIVLTAIFIRSTI
ncbi:MAG TPA: hypothetical protein VEC36_13930 [Patescibacteria group bacterium]|nr:hypothetical protein [Patescibacteria group bacterium]